MLNYTIMNQTSNFLYCPRQATGSCGVAISIFAWNKIDNDGPINL